MLFLNKEIYWIYHLVLFNFIYNLSNQPAKPALYSGLLEWTGQLIALATYCEEYILAYSQQKRSQLKCHCSAAIPGYQINPLSIH